MNQKNEYMTPDFEVFNFITESVLEESNTSTTTRIKPELPEDEFGGVIVF